MLSPIRLILCVIPLVILSMHQVEALFTGDVTAYSDSWQGGNCGFTSLWGSFPSTHAKTYFAALNNPQWASTLQCGQCARVKCTSPECKSRGGKEIIVMITDRCSECAQGDLDLSIMAFKELTGSTPARFKIEWDFIQCPSDFKNGNVEYYIKDGSNPFWVAIQPRNSLKQIIKIEINPEAAGAESKWIELDPPRVTGLTTYFFQKNFPHGFQSTNYRIRAIAEDGSVRVDSFTQPVVELATLLTKHGVDGSPRESPVTATPSPSKSLPGEGLDSKGDDPALTPEPSVIAPTGEDQTLNRDEQVAEEEKLKWVQFMPSYSPSTSLFSSSSSAAVDCPVGMRFEFAEWNGEASFQVFIDNHDGAFKPLSWFALLNASNVDFIEQEWNSDGRIENETKPIIRLDPKPYDQNLIDGITHIGVLIKKQQRTLTTVIDSVTLVLYLDHSLNKTNETCTFYPVTKRAHDVQVTSTLEKRTNGGVIAMICLGLVGIVLVAVLIVMRKSRKKLQEEEEDIKSQPDFVRILGINGNTGTPCASSYYIEGKTEQEQESIEANRSISSSSKSIAL